MSRLIRAKTPGLEAELAADEGKKRAGYLERVAKYVPAEIVAGYLAISTAATDAPAGSQLWIWLGCFVLCLVLTPIYFKKIAEAGDAVKGHLIVSPIAFIVWAYAVGGGSWLFGSDGLAVYHAAFASIALIVFSLLSGAIWTTD